MKIVGATETAMVLYRDTYALINLDEYDFNKLKEFYNVDELRFER